MGYIPDLCCLFQARRNSSSGVLKSMDPVELLDRQLQALSAPVDGDAAHAELQEARRLIAERDEDIRSYEGQVNSLEAERRGLRADAAAAREEA